MNTSKLLIITWVAMALLIGLGVGYLLGVQGVGQKAQQNFGPGPQGQVPQQGGDMQQPPSKAGQPGGQNPLSNSAGQGQQVNPNQPSR